MPKIFHSGFDSQRVNIAIFTAKTKNVMASPPPKGRPEPMSALDPCLSRPGMQEEEVYASTTFLTNLTAVDLDYNSNISPIKVSNNFQCDF